MDNFLRILAIFFIFTVSALSAFASGENGTSQGDDLQNQLTRIQKAINQNPPPSSSAPSAATSTNQQAAQPSANQASSAVPEQQSMPAANPQSNTAQAGPTDMQSAAFARMTNATLPLSPSQVIMLHSLYDATQRAAATYPGVPPRPTSSLQLVNLSPGATPPIALLRSGFVTALVFVDSTGAPWPIKSYSVASASGTGGAFNVQWDKNNILLVQSITSYSVGNLTVILKGLDTPVSVMLQPGQPSFDMRVDLRIPQLGPNAKPNLVSLPGTGSKELLNFLDGISPPNSKVLNVSGCDLNPCAWSYKGKMFLRTHYTVLSPAWIATMSSADGTNVYEMQPTPIILASFNGKTIKMVIEGL